MKKKNKKSGFKRAILIYCLCLLILGEMVLIYVSHSLKMYEKGDLDGYMNYLIMDIQKQGKNGNIDKYFSLKEITNDYENNPSLKKGMQDLLTDAKMTYKANEEEGYDIYADDKLLCTVILDDSHKESRLGLLAFTNYKIKEIKEYTENGLYNIDIYTLSDYDVYVNDNKVLEKDFVSEQMLEEYQEVYDLVSLPKYNYYHIENLTSTPEVTVKDQNNQEVKVTKENGKYYANTFKQTDDEEEAQKQIIDNFDYIQFAKNWSLFLTDDLNGERHGFYVLAKNLLENTAVYNQAYRWATGVDITFTSIHTLAKDTFTNVKADNFTFYNDNAFSVDIYMEKNMLLAGNQKRCDVLNDTFYFVYYDNAYRLTHMKSVTENK